MYNTKIYYKKMKSKCIIVYYDLLQRVKKRTNCLLKFWAFKY